MLGVFAIVVGMLLAGTSHRFWTDGAGLAASMVIFWLSLFIYWVAAYFLTGAVQDRVSDLAHATFMLSIGVFLIFLGTGIVVSNSCVYPTDLKLEPGEVEFVALLRDLQNNGRCAVAGYISIVSGGAFLWPALKQIVAAYVKRARRISREPPSSV